MRLALDAVFRKEAVILLLPLTTRNMNNVRRRRRELNIIIVVVSFDTFVYPSIRVRVRVTERKLRRKPHP